MNDKSPKWTTMFEDETGGYSSRRVLQVIWVLMLVGLIIFLTIRGLALPILPEEYVYLTAAFLGFGVASKYIEKKPVSEIVNDVINPPENKP